MRPFIMKTMQIRFIIVIITLIIFSGL